MAYISQAEFRKRIHDLCGVSPDKIRDVQKAMTFVMIEYMKKGGNFKLIPGVFMDVKYMPEHEHIMPDGKPTIVKAYNKYKLRMSDQITKLIRKYYRGEHISEAEANIYMYDEDLPEVE